MVYLPEDSQIKLTRTIVHLESAFKNSFSDELYLIMYVNKVTTGLIRIMNYFKK